jgi:hypothetical protein
MVLEVDEAGILEAFENGFGGRLLRGGVGGEEGREVDELSRRVLEAACVSMVLCAYGNDQVVLRHGLLLGRACH